MSVTVESLNAEDGTRCVLIDRDETVAMSLPRCAQENVLFQDRLDPPHGVSWGRDPPKPTSGEAPRVLKATVGFALTKSQCVLLALGIAIDSQT